MYLGLTDVTKLELAQAYEVETIIIHPGWNLLTKVRQPVYSIRNTFQDNNILDGHDIALIRLTTEVTLSDTVWPACLPGSNISLTIFQLSFDISFQYTFQLSFVIIFFRSRPGTESRRRRPRGDRGRVWHDQHDNKGAKWR